MARVREIDVVLSDASDRIDESTGSLEDQAATARAIAARLDVLEDEARTLADHEGARVRPSDRSRERRDSPATEPRVGGGLEWKSALALAEKRTRARGIDPASVDLDRFFSEGDLMRLERRFSGSFRLSTRLDACDAAGIALAATVGALVDVFLVRIPVDSALLGERGAALNSGSPVTKWMRDRSQPHDNPLSAWFKVPYDKVRLESAGKIDGSGGKTHRYHTLGHDPVLGLLFGLVDIWFGSTTAIDRVGRLVYLPGTGSPKRDPIDVLVTQFGHVLSDAFTGMGVPAPGWNLAGLLQAGAFGDQGITAGEVARHMYIAGYDFRHFLTQSISVAATDLTLWLYWHVRQRADANWREQTLHEAALDDASSVRGHPRFEALALGAHLAACAANAGKIMLYGGSPLALNYAAWLRFLQASYRYSRRWLVNPSELLARQARSNLDALLDGWPEIDFASNEAPVLNVG